jgi:hypothetical protein
MDNEYTNFIDEEIPKEVLSFTETEEFDKVEYLYESMKRAFDTYSEDLFKFPHSNSMEALDYKYDKDRRRFYKNYKKFADKCSEINSNLSISGYDGVNDIFRVKIRDICNTVSYNFPYGWKLDL